MILRCKHLVRNYTACIVLAGFGVHAHAQTSGLPWIGTWGVGQVDASDSLPSTGENGLIFNQQTVRQIVHTSIGGSTARVQFSNEYGTTPLTIADVHIAQRSSGSSTVSGTDRAITFAGATSVTIAPGARIVSDGVAFTVMPGSDVAISTFYPAANAGMPLTHVTLHPFTEQTSYFAAGDRSSQVSLSATEIGNYYFLTNLDVQNSAAAGAVVAFGASITDGDDSSGDTNHRWPNFLSQRFNAAGMNIGVINKGISGAHLLSSAGFFGDSAESRFSRDVLQQPGVRWVILSDFPLNDVSDPSVTASSLIAGMQSLITQSHQNHLKIFCSVLTPFKGSGGWTPQGEATRQQINTFIRSGTSGCDGIIDQASVIQDPNDPEMIAAKFLGGPDDIHPNDAGYQAIANIVNLSLFAPGLTAIQGPTACGVLRAGQGIVPDQPLMSCDGRFMLFLQDDGNLVIYEGNTPLWATGTVGAKSAQAVLEANGNLVIYDSDGRPLWATNSDPADGATLSLGDDGTLVIRDADGTVWTSTV